MNTNKGNDRVIEVSYKYKPNIKWEKWFLLTSDQHFDSTHCDRRLLKKHHEEAIKRDAGIFCFGDLFDVMQGKNDRRGSKSDLRDEYKGGNYYDLVVEDAVKWYQPYCNNYIGMTYGNHETSIIKHQETDVLKRLVNSLNNKGSSINIGAYSGWVVFRFHLDDQRIRKFRLFYHHGSGGGGPVTKGVIQSNRRAVYLPDADLIVTGHIHEAWHLETMQERLTSNNKPYISTQHHVQLATYKEEYIDGVGWHVERGAPPKPLGGYWLRFYWNRKDDVNFQLIRAN